MNPRVVAVGALYMDIVCGDFPFEDALWPEREVVGSDYRLLPGGSAVNFACTSAGLDIPVTLAGKIGSDLAGRSLRTLVGDCGVSLRAVVSSEHLTNLGIAFNGEAGSVMTAVGTANQTLTGEELLPLVEDAARDASWVYFGGCLKLSSLLPALPEFARELKRQGKGIIVDHGRVYNTLSEQNCHYVRDLCMQSDYYLPSVDELLALWDCEDIEAAVHRVKSECNATIVVKKRRDGVEGFEANEHESCPAFNVSVTNPVGAGDSFNAGFMRATIEGMSLRQRLRFGSATAAIKISKGIFPSFEDVETLASNLNQS